MTKHRALQKWDDATRLRWTATTEEFRRVFPSADTLREFWNDTKDLSWPEFYGQTAWEIASATAYIVTVCPETADENSPYEGRKMAAHYVQKPVAA